MLEEAHVPSRFIHFVDSNVSRPSGKTMTSACLEADFIRIKPQNSIAAIDINKCTHTHAHGLSFPVTQDNRPQKRAEVM